ncbi:MAG: glycosyltransferase, partial [Patescibacteria group bacterium]
MDPQNLNVCLVCRKEPAVYGDGITWARCSKCEYEFRKENPQPQDQEVTEDGFPHKTVKDLVSIIMPVYMVNYPLFHYTGTAIGSIRSHSKKGTYELIIVDNGSPIKPPNMQSYYAHKIVTNETNEGVSKAWNQGIRISFGEYIVLLNNDTQVYEHWMEDMKKCLDEGGLDLVMATPMYSLTEPFARWVESERERDRWKDKPIQESFSDFKDFSCVMFKKDLVDEIGIEGKGLFDEQFFAYASDSDLFKRMDQAGKKYASTKA